MMISFAVDVCSTACAARSYKIEFGEEALEFDSSTAGCGTSSRRPRIFSPNLRGWPGRTNWCCTHHVRLMQTYPKVADERRGNERTSGEGALDTCRKGLSSQQEELSCEMEAYATTCGERCSALVPCGVWKAAERRPQGADGVSEAGPPCIVSERMTSACRRTVLDSHSSQGMQSSRWP